MVPREEAVAAQSRLGLTAPFEASELQRLADLLRAHIIVSGVVSRVNFDYRRTSVSVRVRVEVTEATSGEIVLAANGDGSAQGAQGDPRPTDELVELALQVACERAVGALLRPAPLVGRILAKSGEEEFRIDLSKKDGLTRDRRMLLARQEGADMVVLGVGLVREVADDHSVIVAICGEKTPQLGDYLVAP
jgi:hypothetical protein